MGLFLTLFYILTAYMAPSTLFGGLVEYHIEVVIAVFTLIGSLLASEKPPLLGMSQMWVLMCLAAAIFFSIVTNGWLTGAETAVVSFLPHMFAFVFIVLNCRTIRHLKMVVVVLFSVCLFVILTGSFAMSVGDTTSAFLLPQRDDAGDIFYRLIGQGFINDPNDLSQVMVSLMPCLFFFWKPKKNFTNILFVLLPASILIYGLYLTHSRGATLAFLVVIMVAARKKIGTIPSAVIAGGLFVAAAAIGWTGGRGVSMEAGADRMGAWSAGLEMIKAHPIFGVGYGGFSDHYILTAHNTVIVCAAEIGMFGLFPWLFFVCTSLWQCLSISGYLKKKEPVQEEMATVHGVKHALENSPLANPQGWSTLAMARQATPTPAYGFSGAISSVVVLPRSSVALHLTPIEQEDPEKAAIDEIQRFGRILIISFAGFLTAGWFLSRAFQMTLFVYCGIVQVAYQLALEKKIVPEKPPIAKLMRITAVAAVILVSIVYATLRAEHMMGIH